MEEVFVFPTAEAKALLLRAREAALFPDEIPDGWSKSSIDPMRLLAVFDPLRLKRGIILQAYQYRSSLGGNAYVYAVPEGTPLLEPEECKTSMGRFTDPPILPGALEDFMEAVEGDGSPWSYLSASLLARELMEFGAYWHGCSWSTHTIVDEKATAGQDDYFFPYMQKQAPDLPVIEQDEWKWLSPKPEELDPSVAMSDESATVTFYTISELGIAAVYKHVDSFRAGSYSFSSQKEAMAKGRGGYIF